MAHGRKVHDEVEARQCFGNGDRELARAGNSAGFARRLAVMSGKEQIGAGIKFLELFMPSPINPPGAIDAWRDWQIKRNNRAHCSIPGGLFSFYAIGSQGN